MTDKEREDVKWIIARRNRLVRALFPIVNKYGWVSVMEEFHEWLDGQVPVSRAQHRHLLKAWNLLAAATQEVEWAAECAQKALCKPRRKARK